MLTNIRSWCKRIMTWNHWLALMPIQPISPRREKRKKKTYARLWTLFQLRKRIQNNKKKKCDFGLISTKKWAETTVWKIDAIWTYSSRLKRIQKLKLTNQSCKVTAVWKLSWCQMHFIASDRFLLLANTCLRKYSERRRAICFSLFSFLQSAHRVFKLIDFFLKVRLILNTSQNRSYGFRFWNTKRIKYLKSIIARNMGQEIKQTYADKTTRVRGKRRWPRDLLAQNKWTEKPQSDG